VVGIWNSFFLLLLYRRKKERKEEEEHFEFINSLFINSDLLFVIIDIYFLAFNKYLKNHAPLSFSY